MADVGDIFTIPVGDGIWAAGMFGWKHDLGAYKFAVLDQFWDHEPSADEVAGVDLWYPNALRRDPNAFWFSGESPFTVIAHRPITQWTTRAGCRELRAPGDVRPILYERWRTIHDRDAVVREYRVEARMAGIDWRPAPTLAGWRFENKLGEIASSFPGITGMFEQLRRSLVALDGDRAGALAAIRNTITELNDYHRDEKPLDEEAGELLLRRITQLAHCVGISPSEVAHLSGHRTWPAAPLEPLHLGSASTLPTEKWRDRMASTPDLYSADGIDAVEAVLKAALSERSAKGFSGARANVLSWIQRTVVALNEVDQRFGQIDTQEREELVRWILGVAGGTFSDDPTDRWRTW